MSPAVKNVLMLVAVVAVLAVAGFLFTRGSKDSALPTDAGFTEWMCDTCKKHYNLSAAELDKWMYDAKKREMGRQDQNVVFWCSDCQKFSVVSAEVDPTTGEWYFTTDSKGKHYDPPPTALQPPPGEGEPPQQ